MNPSQWELMQPTTNHQVLVEFSMQLLKRGFWMGINTPSPSKEWTLLPWTIFFDNSASYAWHDLWYDQDDAVKELKMVPFGGWQQGRMKTYHKRDLISCQNKLFVDHVILH